MSIRLPKSPLKSLPKNLQSVTSTIQRVDQKITSGYAKFDNTRSIVSRLSSGDPSGLQDAVSLASQRSSTVRNLANSISQAQQQLNNIKNLSQGINVSNLASQFIPANQPTPLTSKANLNPDVIRNLESQLSQGNFKLNDKLLTTTTSPDVLLSFIGNTVLSFSNIVGALNSSVLEKNLQQFSQIQNRIQQATTTIQQTRSAVTQVQQSAVQLKSSVNQLKSTIRGFR